MNLEDMLPLQQVFDLDRQDAMLEDGNQQLREHLDTRMALDVIGACPALFPCKNALPARNRLGVAQDTSLKSHARWLEQEQKSLVLET